MTAIAFDTLRFSSKLKEAGMEPHLADVQSEEMAKILSHLTVNTLATKQDLKHEIGLLKTDIHDFKIQMYGFIVKVTVFTVGILGGLQTLFHFVP